MIRLEHIGKEIIGQSFYNADELFSHAFCDGMLEVLKVLYVENDELSRFVEICGDCFEKSCHDISDEDREWIFSEFIRLYHLKIDTNI